MWCKTHFRCACFAHVCSVYDTQLSDKILESSYFLNWVNIYFPRWLIFINIDLINIVVLSSLIQQSNIRLCYRPRQTFEKFINFCSFGYEVKVMIWSFSVSNCWKATAERQIEIPSPFCIMLIKPNMHRQVLLTDGQGRYFSQRCFTFATHIWLAWLKIILKSHKIQLKEFDFFLTTGMQQWTIAVEQQMTINWAASSEFGTYRICEQRRFRRACASAQSRQNLRCSLIQAVSQKEPSDRKPDPWHLWIAGHAQLKCIMTECSKTQNRLTRPNYRNSDKKSVPLLWSLV